MLTQSRLKEVLHYNPETGVFTWAMKRKKSRIGDVAGCVDAHGFLRIGVDKGMYPAHRLAWLYMTGSEPPGRFIKHLDGNKTNNRWNNLSLAVGYKRINAGDAIPAK